MHRALPRLVQGLVLCEMPYFNEAGYDKQLGTDEGALQVTTFTSQSAAERHRATMLRFHDGIRLLKNGE